jgi:ribosomal protein S18 acetylase RimI-like enzyme
MDRLRVVEFSAQHLSKVQAFECGSADWCLFAERWIKNAPPFPGALQSIQERGTTVWLYFIDAVGEEFLVGFSSLGVTRWRIPPPDGPTREVGFIPMLGVALSFQGKPNGATGERYSDQIMQHVIEQARERGYCEVCLSVHADNVRARRFYDRYGFETLGLKNGRGNLKMLKLLD